MPGTSTENTRRERAFLAPIRHANSISRNGRMPTTFETAGNILPICILILGVEQPGQHSSAAGAYQILFKTYERAVSAGVADDFTQTSQDAVALHLMSDALPYIWSGQLDAAFGMLAPTWESLPGGAHQLTICDAAKACFWKRLREMPQ